MLSIDFFKLTLIATCSGLPAVLVGYESVAAGFPVSDSHGLDCISYRGIMHFPDRDDHHQFPGDQGGENANPLRDLRDGVRRKELAVDS